jgi:hypothetical protein
VLDELSLFVKYVNTQETNLNSIERQKEDYKNAFFNKDITLLKDIKDIAKN